jgi:recombination protein RecT
MDTTKSTKEQQQMFAMQQEKIAALNTNANSATANEQPKQPAELEKKKIDNTPAKTVDKNAVQEDLVKIQQGLPKELQPLRDCFTEPFKTFIQCGKSVQDLQKECNFAAQAMLNNPYLIECARAYPQHFIAALKNVVLTGMTLNPTLKLAYLVPYKGKVELSPSYMGKCSFAINTGLVKDIYAMLVYKGDKFTFRKGMNATIEHEPNPWGEHKKDDILGGYYFAVLTNGTFKYDVMPIADIEKIKKRSPSVSKGKNSPWDTDYEEMAKKTIINWGYKSLPKMAMSEKAREAITILNHVEDDEFNEYVKNMPQKSDGFDDFEEIE